MHHKSNIVDIAEKSGFSITTVSRVLNGKADKYRISKATQQKIKAMAEELNYVPNEFARNLRTGKSKTIRGKYRSEKIQLYNYYRRQ